jgi:hypothetical protein
MGKCHASIYEDDSGFIKPTGTPSLCYVNVDNTFCEYIWDKYIPSFMPADLIVQLSETKSLLLLFLSIRLFCHSNGIAHNVVELHHGT